MRSIEVENAILGRIVKADVALQRQFKKFQEGIEYINKSQGVYPGVSVENGDGRTTIRFSGRTYLVVPEISAAGQAIVFFKLKNDLPGSEDTKLATYDFDHSGAFQSFGIPEGDDMLLNLNLDSDCTRILQHVLISTAY